jgi:hypothetical protein
MNLQAFKDQKRGALRDYLYLAALSDKQLEHVLNHLASTIDELIALMEREVKATIYQWTRSVEAEYSGVDDIVTREVIANQLVMLLERRGAPTQTK